MFFAAPGNNKRCWLWNSKLLRSTLLILITASIVSLAFVYLSITGINSRREMECHQQRGSKLKLGAEAMEVDSVEPFQLVFPQRIVHLDLKGAPPKLEYLAEVLPLFARLGATGLLIEYEDMFPYRGDLAGLSAKNAYQPSQVEKINLLAKENKLEIIPLVQTFGHLEFVLKLEGFAHLREVPEQPQAICPSQNGTLPLLFAMLKQVAQHHPEAKRIHIGADEVYFIGKCNVCHRRMNQQYWSPSELFVDHVTTMATFVRDQLGLRPMMWDDGFRSFTEVQLARSSIGSLVDVIVWNYQSTHQLGPDIWSKYLNVFDSIWAASAFKGATGSDQYLTDAGHHLENHRSWTSLVSEYKNTPHSKKFKGIMLTGWQRYDHFAILCELLPVALPSLAVNLLYLQLGSARRAEQEANRLLDCSGSILASDMFFCRFPGSEILHAVQGFGQIKEQHTRLMNDSVVRGWLTHYNIVRGFSSPTHLERIYSELGYLQNSIEAFGHECEKTFESVYDIYTIKEWIDTKVAPLNNQISQLISTIDTLRSVSVWPRRPLEP